MDCIEPVREKSPFFKKYFEGRRKKYLMGILSLIAALTVVIPSISGIIVTYNMNSDNPIGINTVQFNVDDMPNGWNSHITGSLYFSREAIKGVWNLTDPQPATAPGIVLMHGFLSEGLLQAYTGFIGRESTGRWAIELCRRGFVVLSIDLPGQGYTTGTIPGIVPRADFETYIVKGAVNYLKNLDIVNSSVIGVAGISYGGSAAAMSAGILGDLINATVVMSGFVNYTDFLIEKILPAEHVEFEVNNTTIKLLTIKGQPATPDDLIQRLRYYKLLKGSSELVDPILIPGTTCFNRTELAKMDAIQYLSGARADSIMFIDPLKDETYGDTNQSGLGYEAATNGAIYFPVDADHQLTGAEDSDWAVINFFKEKLMFNTTNPLLPVSERYGLPSDALGLTYKQFFYSFDTLWSTIAYIIIGAMPIWLIINFIFYTKKYETHRSEEEFPEEEKEMHFGGATFNKIILGMVLMYLMTIVMMTVVGFGYDNGVIFNSIVGIFYVGFYFAMVYVHDDAEICKREKLAKGTLFYHPEKLNSISSDTVKRSVIIGIALILGVSLIAGLVIPKNSLFGFPMDSVALMLSIVGGILIVSGLFYIRKIVHTNQNGITWKEFGMDRYSLFRSIVFASAVGLNFLFFYNIIVFYLKFPFLFGARSPYIIFILFSVMAFSLGIHLWIETIIRRFLNVRFAHLGKKKLWGICTLIGFGVVTLAGYFFSIVFFDFGLWFNVSFYAGLLFGVGYVIARLVELTAVEKGLLSSSIYFPLLIILVGAYFLKI
jgi:pimeloyl-ACP methyl ester carboxylesterase